MKSPDASAGSPVEPEARHVSLSTRNQILASLPPDVLAGLLPHMQRISVASGEALHERGDRIGHVYFLESGLGSLTSDTADSGAVEVGLTGREGFIGVAAMLEDHPLSGQRAFIQIPGEALVLSRDAFIAGLNKHPVLRERCLSYVGSLMNQIAQTAACNARHDVTERLGRWLLMSHDRVDGDVLPLTQEFLSFMLGVRRPGVAVAAAALQAQGVIKYTRGRITVLDRPGLEAVACHCYALIKQGLHRQNEARSGNRPAAA